jgi:putative oxidoreductase
MREFYARLSCWYEGGRQMPPFVTRFAPQAYALLRILAGLFFMFHGTQKLLGWPAPSHGGPTLTTYAAGGVELIGGLLICLGLFTGWAALLASGEMAVAYWWKHGTKDPFPLNNGGELAAIYCFVFLFVALRGAGMWSLDALRRAPMGRSL